MSIVEGETTEVIARINALTDEAAAQGKKTGVLCTEESIAQYRADVVRSLGSRSEMQSIALHLYRALREFDDEGVETIYAESFSRDGFGQAVMNRMLKAAGYTVIQA